MPEFRIDLHTHSRFSADGISDPVEMIEWGQRNGLDGLVLTDHDTCDGVNYLRERDLVDSGGRAVDGFLVIPGQEVTTREGHVLVAGWEPPPSRGISCAELLRIVRDAGGMAIAAHPFDFARSGVGRAVLDQHEFEALEVFNAASWHPSLNRKARAYGVAQEMIMTAGSDAHHPQPIGCACQVVQAEELTVGGIIDALRDGRSHREEKAMGLSSLLTKTFYNCFRPPPGKGEADCREEESHP